MPTRPLQTAVIALAVSGILSEVTVAAPSVEVSASSNGPAGMPHYDPHVEPAAFHALGFAAPLAPPQSVVERATVVRVAEDAPAPKLEPTVSASIATPEPSTSPQAGSVSPPQAEPTTRSHRRSAGSLSGGGLPTTTPSARVAQSASPIDGLLAWRPDDRTLTATAAGTAIAVGLLLSFVWLLRSMTPASARPLPRDVIEVLGRAPLAGKQTTQLVRVGHKLVLVALSPEGLSTLTEVSDPEEVAHIVAACEASRGRGSSADFDSLLKQMERERGATGFLDRFDRPIASSPGGFAEGGFDPRTLAAAYANTPGGRAHG